MNLPAFRIAFVRIALLTACFFASLGDVATALSNHRGDIVGRYDEDGDHVYAAIYGADGNVTAESGSKPDTFGQNTKEADGHGTELVYFGHRYYDPEAGVWDRVMKNIEASQIARAASNFPTTAAQYAELLKITARASRITDRLIANGSTYWARVYSNPVLQGRRFTAAFNRNPNAARALSRGNIMDDVSKQLAAKATLPFLQSTLRGARGADFVNDFLGHAWDVATPGSWQRHVTRYADDYE